MSEQTTPYPVDLDDDEYTDPTVPVARQPSALEMAQNEIFRARTLARMAAVDGNAYYRATGEAAMERSTAYAQIAQAEALTRNAVALETANLAAWNIAPHKVTESWNPGEELISEHKRAKEQHAQMRRSMGLDQEADGAS